jgi:hypothetical protein
MCFPPSRGDFPRRQQLGLDLRCEFEILFMSPALVPTEVVKAESLKGVQLQTVGFYRVVTGFTHPVGPVIHSFERRVDLRQKPIQVFRGNCLSSSFKSRSLFDDPWPEVVN